MINKPNIRILRDVISRAPAPRCIMGLVFKIDGCGTAYCLMGWTIQIWGAYYPLGSNARTRLGLSPAEGDRLFYLNGFSATFFDALDPSLRKACMIAVLDLLLETGEVRWGEALEANLTEDQYMIITNQRGIHLPSYIPSEDLRY